MNAPIITWLSKCLIKKTLDNATSTEEIIKIEDINLFFIVRHNKVVKRKKLIAWFDGIPVD